MMVMSRGKYVLKGFVVFSAAHYSCFFRDSLSDKNWHEISDETHYNYESLEKAFATCLKLKMKPTLLFYEHTDYKQQARVEDLIKQLTAEEWQPKYQVQSYVRKPVSD